jgi:hypothetical protein
MLLANWGSFLGGARDISPQHQDQMWGGGKLDHGYYEIYEVVKLERGERLV